MKAGKLIDQKIIVSPDQQIVAPINQSTNHTSIQEEETNTNLMKK